MPLTLTAPAFADGEAIPRVHTCEGEDTAPALRWSGAPKETQTFAIIVDDPDAPDPKAPKRTYVHWVLYNVPADTHALPEGVTAGTLPPDTMEGKNDWGRTGFGGPCPPIGRHRYFFKLYALDAKIPDLRTPTKQELESAMEGHVIEKAVLMGTYEKAQR